MLPGSREIVFQGVEFPKISALQSQTCSAGPDRGEGLGWGQLHNFEMAPVSSVKLKWGEI